MYRLKLIYASCLELCVLLI